jgi:hypothetical protein
MSYTDLAARSAAADGAELAKTQAGLASGSGTGGALMMSGVL